MEALSDTWPPDDPLFDPWADLHDVIHRGLDLRPWQFWCIEPPNIEGEEQSIGARALYRELAQATGIPFE